ncbi:hypothetical protein AHAS_Ahas02G0187700 [Arachis hypogaea]
MKKVRKTGGEDFSGRTGLPHRIEDWMVAEEVIEGNGCQEGGNPRTTQPEKQRWGINSFAEIVKTGKSTEQREMEAMVTEEAALINEEGEEEYS